MLVITAEHVIGEIEEIEIQTKCKNIYTIINILDVRNAVNNRYM